MVISCGGDVLKFAGDALFAEWRVVAKEEHHGNLTGGPITIEDCLLTAAMCGAQIVAECSEYPIYSTTGMGRTNGVQIAALNVHCGLGVGEIVSVHVGNFHDRRELLVMGETINQVSEAERAASLGELVASPEALLLLRQTCKIMNSMQENVPSVIASHQRRYFSLKRRRKKHVTRTPQPIDGMLSVFVIVVIYIIVAALFNIS